jgi:hypothetical protein
LNKFLTETSDADLIRASGFRRTRATGHMVLSLFALEQKRLKTRRKQVIDSVIQVCYLSGLETHNYDIGGK